MKRRTPGNIHEKANLTLSLKSQTESNSNPLLIVISGPSGVGKDAILSRMKELERPFHFTITATTRPIRDDEVEDVHYIFKTRYEFQNMIDHDQLLEYAEVYGNYYGMPKSQVIEPLNRGQDVIIKADVQGAATIRKLIPDAITIFIAPPDEEELKRRLSDRMTESSESLSRRLETATRELGESSKFDYAVVNHRDGIDAAVREIEEIIEIERQRRTERSVAP